MTNTVESLVEDVAAGRMTAEDAASLVGALVRRWVYKRRNYTELLQDMRDDVTLRDDPPLGGNAQEFITWAREAGKISQQQHDVLWGSWDDTRQFTRRTRRHQAFRTLPQMKKGANFTEALATYFDLDVDEFSRLFGADWRPAPKKYQLKPFGEPGEWLEVDEMAPYWVFAGKPLAVVMGISADSVKIGPAGVLESGTGAFGTLVEFDLEAGSFIDRIVPHVSEIRVAARSEPQA